MQGLGQVAGMCDLLYMHAKTSQLVMSNFLI